LLKQAIDAGLVEVHCGIIGTGRPTSTTGWTTGRMGGGPGMVLCPQPIVDCLEAVQAKIERPGKVVMLTPAGRRMDQRVVEELANESRILLLCGRYEGFDDRIRQVVEPMN
jgi:tRNA (guanine37-N1)-methyltransferase